jgi:hypothetical protein
MTGSFSVVRESLRQMIISIERGGAFGDMWRADLAAVFARELDDLFTVPLQSPLPQGHLPGAHSA